MAAADSPARPQQEGKFSGQYMFHDGTENRMKLRAAETTNRLERSDTFTVSRNAFFGYFLPQY